jgi:hypothetical protein
VNQSSVSDNNHADFPPKHFLVAKIRTARRSKRNWRKDSFFSTMIAIMIHMKPKRFFATAQPMNRPY